MHCQSYFFIFSLLIILSSSSLVKSEDNAVNSSIEIPDRTVYDKLAKSSDLSAQTAATANRNLGDNSIGNSNRNTQSQSNRVAPGKSVDDRSEDSVSSNSSDSRSRSILDYIFPASSPFTTVQPDATDLPTTTVLSDLTTTTVHPDLTTESLKDVKEEIKKQDPKHCVFFMLAGEPEIKIQPNSTHSNYFSDLCFKSERLNLTSEEVEFENKFDALDNKSIYTLRPFVDKHYDNHLQLRLQRISVDAFRLSLSWLQVNPKTANKNYGLLLTIYEDLESIGKLFITDKLVVNRSKEVQFYNLNNLTYSISLSLVDYFENDSKVYLEGHKQDYESPDRQMYLIKNVYREMQATSGRAAQAQLNSNSQIAIYSIASLLLLAIVCGLLYVRRNKFKSLINHHLDKAATHQNSKYLRHRKDPPAINVLHFDNSVNGSSFEHQFLKNTAQLSCNDRTSGGAFNFRNAANNSREKLSLSKSGIGRVLNHSVATIKKRTTLKSINPSTIEFDLRRMGQGSSTYSHSIPLIEFLPLLHELTKTNSQKLFNEFMQLNVFSNGSNTAKKSNKVGRNSKNIGKNKDASVIPYDHSRVVLEPTKYLSSDYYNGSYIPGMNYEAEYIACQSPLRSTTYAFWLMCLQQNVKYIVMTTQLIDSSSFVDKYWPDMISEDGESMKQIEEITIKLKDKRRYPIFTIRIFEVKMNDETRVIKHYQLTDWNFEIENAQNVLMITSFIEMFREEIGCEQTVLNDSPIVVHCSNGVGKTAIFIAIDRIYVQLKKGKSDYIDIFKTVIDLRQQRPLMVQNEAQYRFIYETVGQLISKLYPSLVKQAEFDLGLDEINLNDKTDFDANNNLGNSFNSQISLMSILKNGGRPAVTEGKRLNGYTNHTFLNDSTQSISQRSAM